MPTASTRSNHGTQNRRPGEGTTRQTILTAAAKRFASASYDEVSLRDISADVDVDVAYVHRSFGSKENLFPGGPGVATYRAPVSQCGGRGLGEVSCQRSDRTFPHERSPTARSIADPHALADQHKKPGLLSESGCRPTLSNRFIGRLAIQHHPVRR
ncbi:TetR/AcrR family transcriptional regulator [Ancylobacter dichloromethanicus]